MTVVPFEAFSSASASNNQSVATPYLSTDRLPPCQLTPGQPNFTDPAKQIAYHKAMNKWKAHYFNEASSKDSSAMGILTPDELQYLDIRRKSSAGDEVHQRREPSQEDPDTGEMVKKCIIAIFVTLGLILFGFAMYSIRRSDVQFEEKCKKRFLDYYNQCTARGESEESCGRTARRYYDSCEMEPIDNFMNAFLSVMWYGFCTVTVGLCIACCLGCVGAGLIDAMKGDPEKRKKRRRGGSDGLEMGVVDGGSHSD